jgi:predicted site-specific integrase-resolvase
MTDTLTRWGDIALYLKVSEKTAMRYHKKRGLPVVKDPAGHPIIKKADIDKWRGYPK